MLKKAKQKLEKVLSELPLALYARANGSILQLGTDEHTLIFLLQMVAMNNLGADSIPEANALAQTIAKEHQQLFVEAQGRSSEAANKLIMLVDSATSTSSNAYAYIAAKHAIEAYRHGDMERAIKMTVYAAVYLINAGKEDEDERTQKSGTSGAHARHDAPGGSRAKQDAIRRAWATGKFTSRDRCAEEECGALDISFSTARKALRNTPDPT